MDLKKITESIARHEEVLAEAAVTAVARVKETADRIAADLGAALTVARDLGHLSLGEVGAKATAVWTNTIELPYGIQGTKHGGVTIYFEGNSGERRVVHEGPIGLNKGKYRVVVALIHEDDE